MNVTTKIGDFITKHEYKDRSAFWFSLRNKMKRTTRQSPKSAARFTRLNVTRDPLHFIFRIKTTKMYFNGAKEKYRGMFEIQKSGDKTSSGEIGIDIRTHASPKMGQDQVSGGVSVPCRHATPVADALWNPILYSVITSNSVKSQVREMCHKLV